MCICAIAVGVYSIKNANLSVNGTIGFEAHDCLIEVGGSVSAYDGPTAESKSTKNITSFVLGKDSNSKTLNINENFSSTLNFNDLNDDGKTISVILTMKNVSAFLVDAEIMAPIFSSENISLSTSFYLDDEAVTADDVIKVKIDSILKVVFTFEINSTETSFNESVAISGCIAKFTKASSSFKITQNISNVTAMGDTILKLNEIATIEYKCADCWCMPDAITVTGADYVYDVTSLHTATVTLSNPTGPISVKINAVSIYYVGETGILVPEISISLATNTTRNVTYKINENISEQSINVINELTYIDNFVSTWTNLYTSSNGAYSTDEFTTYLKDYENFVAFCNIEITSDAGFCVGDQISANVEEFKEVAELAYALILFESTQTFMLKK